MPVPITYFSLDAPRILSSETSGDASGEHIHRHKHKHEHEHCFARGSHPSSLLSLLFSGNATALGAIDGSWSCCSSFCHSRQGASTPFPSLCLSQCLRYSLESELKRRRGKENQWGKALPGYQNCPVPR